MVFKTGQSKLACEGYQPPIDESLVTDFDPEKAKARGGGRGKAPLCAADSEGPLTKQVEADLPCKPYHVSPNPRQI